MLLQTGQLLSNVGTQTTSIAFPLLVLAVTHSPAKAGVVGFARSLPWVLFALPAGLAADRWSRRRLMILSDGVRVLAIGTLAVTILLDRVAFWEVGRRPAPRALDLARLCGLSHLAERLRADRKHPADRARDSVDRLRRSRLPHCDDPRPAPRPRGVRAQSDLVADCALRAAR